jgi:hypothetical protein
MANVDPGLKKLQAVNWSGAVLSLWTLHFQGPGAAAARDVRFVDTAPKLQARLEQIVQSAMRGARSTRRFDYVTADLEDDQALTIEGGDLLGELQESTTKLSADRILGNAVPYDKDAEEMLKAAGYLVRLEAATGEVLLAFKRMPERPVKVDRLFEAFFTGRKLNEGAEKPRLRLSRTVDALHFENVSYVLNKREFEAGLRYREAMRETAGAVVEEITKAGVLSNPGDLLQGPRGENYQVLRRLAALSRKPDFKAAGWLEKVRALNARYNWKLVFNESGAIVVNEETLSTILSLLADRRALTLIGGQMIDADVAHPVPSS